MFKKGLFLGLALTMVCLVNTTVFCDVTKANLYIELVNVVPHMSSFFRLPWSKPELEPPRKNVTVRLSGRGSEISVTLRHKDRTNDGIDIYNVFESNMPGDWANLQAIGVFFDGEIVAETRVNGLSNKGDVKLALIRKGKDLEIMR